MAVLMARGANGIGDLDGRQVQIVCVTSMLVFLSTLAVALRFISRRISTRYMCMDDHVILFALVRETSFSFGSRCLTFASSYFRTEIASVSLLVSGAAFAA